MTSNTLQQLETNALTSSCCAFLLGTVAAAARTPAEQDEKMREQLQTLKSERLAKLQQTIQHADQMRAVRVHGVNPGEDVDPDGKPIHEQTEQQAKDDWQETVLHAEMNVYEEFASRYCKGVVNAPIVCMEIREMFNELSHELQAVTRGSVSKENGSNSAAVRKQNSDRERGI